MTRTFVYLPLKMLHLLVTGVAVYLQLALALSMYEGRRVNHLASSPTVLAQTSEPRRAGLRRFHAGMKKKAFAAGGRWACGEGGTLKRVLGGLDFPPRIPLLSYPPASL